MRKRIRALYEHLKKISPLRIIAVGFLLIILTGAVLLTLPISSRSGNSTGFINALFTATSATCVTGLIVFDTAMYWSSFGQIVILTLIQVGGLGFITVMSLFWLLSGQRITLRDRVLLSTAIGQESLAGIVRVVKLVLKVTFITEGIGALVLCIKFIPQFGFANGLYKGIFHSVSAFCNAGFDVMGRDYGEFDNLSHYIGSPLVSLTICSLIFLGGLGFVVWNDIIKNRRFSRLSLHSRLVIKLSLFLVFVGAAAIFFFEYNNTATIGNQNLGTKMLASLFQSVTTRTAGFNTMPQGTMTQASKFFSSILMFIGGSPGSTAGGIKTATFGVLIFAVVSIFRGHTEVNISGRKIPTQIIMQSITIITVALTAVSAGIIILSFNETQPLIDLAFEVVSAFATVGLSTGITGGLSAISKLTLISLMFLGRVGIMTLGISLVRKVSVNIKYPEEKIIVG